MATFEKTLEQRLSELETIVWELPARVDARFERFDGEFAAMRLALADNTKRLVQLERAVVMLQTDVRDIRAGLTRSLAEMREQIEGFGKRLDELTAELREQIGLLVKRQGELASEMRERAAGLMARLDEHATETRRRFDQMAAREAARDKRLDEMQARQDETNTKLAQILDLLRVR